MATLNMMYPPQSNTPELSIAADITESETHITVINGAALPAAPNLLTLGADTTSAETVLMTAKNNNVITVQRGYDGTTPLAWPGGTLIGRYFCAADQKAIQDNIHAINADVESRAKVSRSISLTIPTSTWINGENTIPVDGLSANSNGIIGCSATITAEQLAAAKLAELSISGQSDGNITVKASGTVPSVDIPVTLTIIG